MILWEQSALETQRFIVAGSSPRLRSWRRILTFGREPWRESAALEEDARLDARGTLVLRAGMVPSATTCHPASAAGQRVTSCHGHGHQSAAGSAAPIDGGMVCGHRADSYT